MHAREFSNAEMQDMLLDNFFIYYLRYEFRIPDSVTFTYLAQDVNSFTFMLNDFNNGIRINYTREFKKQEIMQVYDKAKKDYIDKIKAALPRDEKQDFMLQLSGLF